MHVLVSLLGRLRALSELGEAAVKTFRRCRRKPGASAEDLQGLSWKSILGCRRERPGHTGKLAGASCFAVLLSWIAVKELHLNYRYWDMQ